MTTTPTNREIVIPIVKKFYQESLGDIDLTLMIEQALNEAERRGYEKGVIESAREFMCKDIRAWKPVEAVKLILSLLDKKQCEKGVNELGTAWCLTHDKNWDYHK